MAHPVTKKNMSYLKSFGIDDFNCELFVVQLNRHKVATVAGVVFCSLKQLNNSPAVINNAFRILIWHNRTVPL